MFMGTEPVLGHGRKQTTVGSLSNISSSCKREREGLSSGDCFRTRPWKTDGIVNGYLCLGRGLEFWKFCG